MKNPFAGMGVGITKAARQMLGIGGSPGPQDVLRDVYGSPVGTPPLINTRSMLEGFDSMPWLRAVADKVGGAMALTDWRLYAVGPGAPEAMSVEGLTRGLVADADGRYTFDVAAVGRAAADRVAELVAREALRARGRLEPWVRKDSILARQAGEARWKRLEALRKQGQLQEIADHPLLDALENPNPFMGRAGLIKLTEISLDIVGDAFWLYDRSAAGPPAGFWPIPAHWIVQTPVPGWPYYRVNWRQWHRLVPESEILWFHEPAPIHPYDRGSGLGFALGDELEIDEYLAKMTKQMFFNDADPKWIFALPDGTSEAEAKRLDRGFLQQHQGMYRKFKPHFMAGGDMENVNNRIHEFQRPTMEQLVYPGLRKAQRDVVLQTWGVPAEVFGISEHGTLAQTNYEGAEWMLAKWVLLPRGERLRSIFQSKLLPLYDDRLIIDYPSPVQADKAHELEIRKAAAWAWTADEWRKLAGDAPLGGEPGKSHLVPLNSHITTDLTDAAQRPVGGSAIPPGAGDPSK